MVQINITLCLCLIILVLSLNNCIVRGRITSSGGSRSGSSSSGRSSSSSYGSSSSRSSYSSSHNSRSGSSSSTGYGSSSRSSGYGSSSSGSSRTSPSNANLKPITWHMPASSTYTHTFSKPAHSTTQSSSSGSSSARKNFPVTGRPNTRYESDPKYRPKYSTHTERPAIRATARPGTQAIFTERPKAKAPVLPNILTNTERPKTRPQISRHDTTSDRRNNEKLHSITNFHGKNTTSHHNKFNTTKPTHYTQHNTTSGGWNNEKVHPITNLHGTNTTLPHQNKFNTTKPTADNIRPSAPSFAEIERAHEGSQRNPISHSVERGKIQKNHNTTSSSYHPSAPSLTEIERTHEKSQQNPPSQSNINTNIGSFQPSAPPLDNNNFQRNPTAGNPSVTGAAPLPPGTVGAGTGELLPSGHVGPPNPTHLRPGSHGGSASVEWNINQGNPPYPINPGLPTNHYPTNQGPSNPGLPYPTNHYPTNQGPPNPGLPYPTNQGQAYPTNPGSGSSHGESASVGWNLNQGNQGNPPYPMKPDLPYSTNQGQQYPTNQNPSNPGLPYPTNQGQTYPMNPGPGSFHGGPDSVGWNLNQGNQGNPPYPVNPGLPYPTNQRQHYPTNQDPPNPGLPYPTNQGQRHPTNPGYTYPTNQGHSNPTNPLLSYPNKHGSPYPPNSVPSVPYPTIQSHSQLPLSQLGPSPPYSNQPQIIHVPPQTYQPGSKPIYPSQPPIYHVPNNYGTGYYTPYVPPPPPPGYSYQAYPEGRKESKFQDVVLGLALWDMAKKAKPPHHPITHHYQPTYNRDTYEYNEPIVSYQLNYNPKPNVVGSHNTVIITNFVSNTTNKNGTLTGTMACRTIYNLGAVRKWVNLTMRDFHRKFPRDKFPGFVNGTMANFTVLPGNIIHNETAFLTCCGTNGPPMPLEYLTNGKSRNVNCITKIGKIPFRKMIFVKHVTTNTTTPNPFDGPWVPITLVSPTNVTVNATSNSTTTTNSTTNITTNTLNNSTSNFNVTVPKAFVDTSSIPVLVISNDKGTVTTATLSTTNDNLNITSQNTKSSTVGVTQNPSELIIG